MLVRSRLLVQLELALPWKPLLGWVWGVEHRCALEMGKLGIQHANVLMVYLDHIYNCFVPMDSMDPENWVIVIVYTHPKTGIILTQLSQNSGVCWTPPCIQGSICLKAQVPPRWLMAQAAGSVSYTRNLGKHLGNCSKVVFGATLSGRKMCILLISQNPRLDVWSSWSLQATQG